MRDLEELTCAAEGIYDRLHYLLRTFSDRPLVLEEHKELKRLVSKWRNDECPGSCAECRCRYAAREEWTEYHGFTTLYDLIDHLPNNLSPRLPMPASMGSGDAMDSWRTRPGHYNP